MLFYLSTSQTIQAILEDMNDLNDTQQGFSQRLRSLRKQNNLSQAELARATGVHTSHIGRYERDKSQPSADKLKKMADILNVSSDYLIEGASPKAAKASFEDRELLQQFQKVEQMPEEEKNVIKILLDAFIIKQQLKKLAG